MKLRSIALAGIALAALSSPASAATGWYIGLGGGMSNLDPVRLTHSGPSFSGTVKHDSSGVFGGSFGYKFEGIVRLENEIGYSSHDVKAGAGQGGSTEVTTNMINMVAEVPLYENINLSVGGGLGIGRVHENLTQGTFTLANGTKTGFAWQAIAGLSIPVDTQIDLFADFRYRNVELNEKFRTSFTAYNPIIVKGTHESNIVFGVRWYIQ
jgi:opacity protein-like surface antigen